MALTSRNNRSIALLVRRSSTIEEQPSEQSARPIVDRKLSRQHYNHIAREPRDPQDVDRTRRELHALDAAERLKAEEVAAIQAQIAGIRAGASADAYAEVFADIASRRKDLEKRRGLLSASLGNTKASGNSTRPSGALAAQALKDADQVLSDPDISGFEKRNLIGIVVEKVLCKGRG